MNLKALKDAEAKRIVDELTKENEEAQKEERKMNSTKFPREVNPCTSLQSQPPKMELGQYVPLWYYTNAGLANQTTFSSTDDNMQTNVT